MHRGPCGKHRLNTNKRILFGTIHSSLYPCSYTPPFHQILARGPSPFPIHRVGAEAWPARGSGRLRRRRRPWSGGEGPRALAHPWVASARAAVAQRGLAARAGGYGRASAGGNHTRQCKQMGKRHNAHGETQGR